MATRGKTMVAILNLLEVRAFNVFRVLEPGFPHGGAVLDHGRKRLIGMKAGGFGDGHMLRRAIDQFHRNTATPAEALP